MRVVPVRSLAGMRRLVLDDDTLDIEVVEHWKPQLAGTHRRPLKRRTVGFSFLATWNPGAEPQEGWCNYPKASELRFNEDGTATFHPGRERTWTLRFWSDR